MSDKNSEENKTGITILKAEYEIEGNTIRYLSNPFITHKKEDEKDGKITYKEGMFVPVETKRRVIKTIDQEVRRDYAVTEREGIVTHTFVEQQLVDNDQFIKLYSRYVTDWLLNLSKAAQRTLVIVLRTYQTKGLNQDSVFLNYRIAKQYEESMARSTFQRGLNELHRAKIIAPSAVGQGWYWVNPHYFFNGDRIAFGKVIRRRNKTEDPDQQMLPIENEISPLI